MWFTLAKAKKERYS